MDAHVLLLTIYLSAMVQKTAWLAMFYMCIPTGVALGYVYGGIVSSHLSFDLHNNV